MTDAGRTGEAGEEVLDDGGDGDGGDGDGGDGDGGVVDAVGLRCPLPVIRLAAAARAAGPGSILTLLSNDPAAAEDVAAWCRMRGHELLERRSGPDGVLHQRVRVR